MNKKRFKYEYGWIWNENGEKFDVNECEGQRLVCDKLNEQQATIRRLQDLCGKSDGENSHLRIENKRLQEENEQLKNKLNKEYIKERSIQ